MYMPWKRDSTLNVKNLIEKEYENQMYTYVPCTCRLLIFSNRSSEYDGAVRKAVEIAVPR